MVRTGCPALSRPLLQVLKRGQAARQVGLDRDARLELGELFERTGEGGDRQVDGSVLLHVEVDEGA